MSPTAKAPLTSSTARLALALSTSSLLLAATAAGPWSFWPCALLWPAPLLIAGRCLPVALAVPVVFVTTALGRAVAFHAGALADSPVPAVCAAAVLCAVVVVDRFVDALLPRASWFTFPCGVVVAARALEDTQVAQVLAPLPDVHAVAYMAQDAGNAGALFFACLLATAFGSIGTAHNRRDDRYGQEERERGISLHAIGAIFGGALLFIAAAVRARFFALPSTERCDPGNVVAGASAVGLVVLVALALSTWRARKDGAAA